MRTLEYNILCTLLLVVIFILWKFLFHKEIHPDQNQVSVVSEPFHHMSTMYFIFFYYAILDNLLFHLKD